jgi:WD40 repeat protein
MSGIFICFRMNNGDLAGKRLSEALVPRIGRDRVFVDDERVHYGGSFPDEIAANLADAEVFVPIIGPGWAEAAGQSGMDLNDPDDFVRVEFELANEKNITTIPVYVNDASVNLPPGLPGAVRKVLDGTRALRLRKGDYTEDIAKIADVLVGAVTFPDCPYPGLAALTRTEYFFGRTKEVADLTALVARNPVVAVAGPSGCGKSSLVLAGLLPEVDCLGVPFRPVLTDTPAEMLRNTLREATNWDGRLSKASACAVGKRLAETVGKPVILFVDQFEELADHSPRAAAKLFDLVHAMAGDGDHVRAVFTMRSADFDVVRSRALRDVHERATLPIEPLAGADLTETITGPARAAGEIPVAKGLVDAILADVDQADGQQSLIAFVMEKLWYEPDKGVLSHEKYHAMKGLGGALSEHADYVIRKEDRDLARRLFTQLAQTVKHDDTFVMAPKQLAELTPELRELAERLSGQSGGRLVSIRRDPGQPAVVALTHAVLIHKWATLRDWLVDDRDFITWHERVKEWTAANVVLRGTELVRAREWYRTHGDRLFDNERRYVLRNLRRRRRMVTGLSLVLVLVLVASVGALVAARFAYTLRDAAISRQVAGTAALLRGFNPALSAQLALAAYRLNPSETAYGTLATTFASPYAISMTGHRDVVEAVAVRGDGKVYVTVGRDAAVRLWDATSPYQPRVVHTIAGMFRSAAFSPDGKTLALGGADHTVRLFDVVDPAYPAERQRLTGHRGEVTSLAFDRRGTALVTADSARFAVLWSVAAAAPRARFEGVTSVAISPDGRTVAAGVNHVVRRWDISVPGAPVPLPVADHGDAVLAVAFSPDGHTLVATGPGMTRLWDVTTPEPVLVHRLPMSGRTGTALAFTSDGQTLAVGRADGWIFLWDSMDPRELVRRQVYTGPEGEPTSLAFTRDGRHLLVGGAVDNTVRQWDLPPPALRAHTGTVFHAGYNRDGSVLATGSGDRTGKLWNVADPRTPRLLATLPGHAANVDAAVFAPTGTILATASFDGTARLWDVADPGAPRHLGTARGGHRDGIVTAAFTPDSRTLATGSFDGTVRLWDVGDPTDPKPGAVLDNGRGWVTMLAIAENPGGAHIAAVVKIDGAVSLWDITNPHDPRPRGQLAGHDNETWTLAVTTDGRTLATGSYDRTFRLWDISDPEDPVRLAERAYPNKEIVSVAFSPDGTRFATGTRFGTVDLWDLADRADPVYVTEMVGVHSRGIEAIAFRPDGHTMTTASADNYVRQWELDPERTAHRVCAVAYPRITAEQWARYVPDLDFEPPC